MDEPPLGGMTAEWSPSSQFGHYVLLRLLGSGGFGEVYEARDTKKKRTVALKLLPASISANPVFRARLFREATTAGQLNEPHVVPIHDYGEIDGQLYIDMRLIRGSDLRAVLDASGPLDPARAVSIVGQIASALDAAHDEAIVHRDVKPANILLTPEDFACLVDFGLANAATNAKLTTAGNTVGTFAYMAPERLADAKIDHRVDIYALACVLHECLTGTAPFVADELAALIAAHLTSPIPRPSQQRPGLPADFDDVIARGMAKDPDDRYAKAGELATAAREALDGGPRRRNDETVTNPAVAAAVPVATPPQPISVPRSRRPALLAAGVVAVLAAAGAGSIGWLTNHHPADAPPAAAKPQTSIARIAATISVGKRPEAIAVDPITHTVYTANYGDDTVSVVDTARRSVITTVHVGHGPASVAVDSNSHTAVTANNRDDTATVIDTTSHTVTATVKVGTNPWGVAIDPTTRAAYVANQWDYSVSVINLDNHTVLATIPVGKNPYGVAVDNTTHTAYTANSSDGTLSVIDTGTLAVTATIPVGNDPRGVAIDAGNHNAYITNEAEGTATVINLDSQRVAAIIHIGDSPFGVAVDPDRHTAFTANHDSALSVIDTRSLSVNNTIRIGKDTFSVAVDPTSHTVYTANQDNTVAVIEPGLP